MTTPTPAQIAEGRELLAKATALPWHLLPKDGRKPRVIYAADDDLRYIARCQDGPCFHSPTPDDDNAELIWTAVNAYPAYLALCERVRALEAEPPEWVADGWLTKQLRAWPHRVHPDRTTSAEWLMCEAATVIENLSALLPTPPQEQHNEGR
jgi:hypothetical protein